MTQQNLEEQVAWLESKIAEYEAERTQMRELGGLRTDIKELHAAQHELRDDLRLRIQATGAEIRDDIDTQADALRTEYHSGYTYLGKKIGNVETAVEQLQAGQQGLAVGQQQILDILLGKPKRND